TKQVVQIADARAGPYSSDLVDLAGARTILGVPMLKDEELVGAIGIYRQEVRPFTDKQIDVVTNFARQAVIAIENTRLTNQLGESLENHTASADILRAIASSPAKAERALNVIAETTARRFEASNVIYGCSMATYFAMSVRPAPRPNTCRHCSPRVLPTR